MPANTTPARPRHDDRRFMDLQMGLFGGQAFFVAFELGLFPLLEEAPLSIAEVAGRLELAPRSAEAILLLCTSLDLLERQGDQFSLTPLAEDYLLPESPFYYGDFLKAAVINQPDLTSFLSIKRAVLDNKWQIYQGKKLFEVHEQEQARARDFTMMMHGHSVGPAAAWPEKFDLSTVRHMVDIGGGSGAHAIGAARHWPELAGTVFEIPAVQQVTREVIAREGFEHRIDVQVGDFFADPLPGGDLHFYGDIFHDWPAGKCLDLAKKSFDALSPGGRIMIHEVLYNDDKTGPFVAAALTIVMLAWTEGVQRSGLELGNILTEAGFEDIAVANTFGYWSIVSACKPIG